MGNTALITEGIATDNGGQITTRKFTLTWDFIAAQGGAALTVDIPLFTLPRGGVILWALSHPTIQFAGTTTLTVSVGDSGSATRFTAASADLVGTAVADTVITQGPTSATCGASIAAKAINAHFIATVTNLNTLTAGSVDLIVSWLNPSAVPSNIG